jgi:hypothetical protein
MKPLAGKCKTCLKPIYWALAGTGSRMPMDADPVPDGGWVLSQKADGSIHAAVFMPTDPDMAKRKRYQSHFASCPQAAAHRRSR